MKPLHPKMLCAKFDLNWLSSSEEDWFLKKICHIFLLFRCHLSLERNRALHFYELESDALCRIWLKLAKWFCLQTDRQTDGQRDDRRPEKLTWFKTSKNCKILPLNQIQATPFKIKLLKQSKNIYIYDG